MITGPLATFLTRRLCEYGNPYRPKSTAVPALAFAATRPTTVPTRLNTPPVLDAAAGLAARKAAPETTEVTW